ncbi:MAG: hypothetical protein P4N41_13800 [Negativicutes bacterium]|nr:hypothetical protein [Negativicutes bacterium]MDR3590722.1 hypothetical protein [Negativicutes bacterium]
MVDVPIPGSVRRDDRQPKHGPWGGKTIDALSNPQGSAQFPPGQKVEAIPKPHPEKPDR